MADPKRVGRVFCVTGTSRGESITFLEHQSKGSVSSSDTDSNSSGYVSSSSLDSAGEDKRTLPNEQKVFQMWERWGHHVQSPKSSTPSELRVRSMVSSIENSNQAPKTSTPNETSALRRVTATSSENFLCIRKNLGKSRITPPAVETNPEKDSFWDIEVPERLSACNVSERIGTTCNRPRSVPLSKSHDAGLDIPLTRRSSDGDSKITTTTTTTSTSTDWRRRPYLTHSNSDSDLPARDTSTSKTRQHSGSSCGSNNSDYNSLPRYRVKVDDSTELSTNIAKRLTDPSTDFSDEGVCVDESMVEFISSVDKDNLAGILQFYDHVTSESANRKPKNNQKPRYESVYF